MKLLKLFTYGLVFSSSIFLLTGCDFSSSQPKLSFEDSYPVFVDNLFSAELFSFLDVLNSDVVSDTIDANLVGGNADMDINVDLKVHSLTDTKTADSETNFDFVVGRYDAVKQLPLDLSGQLELKFLSQKLYAKINNFSLDSGPGNAEANLISLVLGNYLQKWILMDDPNTIDVQHLDSSKILQIYQLPQSIKKGLINHNIFVLAGQEKKSGVPSYKVSLDKEEFGLFLSGLNLTYAIDLSGLVVDGDIYLRVHSADDVSLTFDGVKILSSDPTLSGEVLYEILGEIDARSVKLTIVDHVTENNYDIFFGQRKDAFDLNIILGNSLDENNRLTLDITPKKIGDVVNLSFVGDIELTPMHFYDSIVLDLKGVYSIAPSSITGFTLPENVLLLHQILGDQFALPAMIEE